jgi:hypothetical protein
MKVIGDAWIGQGDSDEYWAEGVKSEIRVETTDVDEVRIGVHLPGEDSEAAGVYLSRAEADKLAKFLTAAAVADVGAIA